MLKYLSYYLSLEFIDYIYWYRLFNRQIELSDSKISTSIKWSPPKDFFELHSDFFIKLKNEDHLIEDMIKFHLNDDKISCHPLNTSYYHLPFIFRIISTLVYFYHLNVLKINSYIFHNYKTSHNYEKYVSDEVILFISGSGSYIYPYYNILSNIKNKSLILSVYKPSMSNYYQDVGYSEDYIYELIKITHKYKTVQIISHSLGSGFVELLFRTELKDKIINEIMIEPANFISSIIKTYIPVFYKGFYETFKNFNKSSKNWIFNFIFAYICNTSIVKNSAYSLIFSAFKILDRQHESHIIISKNDPLFNNQLIHLEDLELFSKSSFIYFVEGYHAEALYKVDLILSLLK